jgi:hypothetical protein
MKDELAKRRAAKGIATITISANGKQRLVRDIVLALEDVKDPLAVMKARAPRRHIVSRGTKL